MAGREIYRRRAKPSGVQLSDDDASAIKGMRLRGDRQHDIAAWFGVNPGRVAEVLCGEAFDNVEATEASKLPPAGPYLSGRAALEAVQALVEAKAALIQAEEKIRATSR